MGIQIYSIEGHCPSSRGDDSENKLPTFKNLLHKTSLWGGDLNLFK